MKKHEAKFDKAVAFRNLQQTNLNHVADKMLKVQKTKSNTEWASQNKKCLPNMRNHSILQVSSTRQNSTNVWHMARQFIEVYKKRN